MAAPTIDIRETNLYINAKIVYFPDSGESLLIREPIEFQESIKDRHHTCRIGDRLDLLAWKYYSADVPYAHELWWVIAEANHIFNPHDLSDYVGKDLLIPDYENVRFKI